MKLPNKFRVRRKCGCILGFNKKNSEDYILSVINELEKCSHNFGHMFSVFYIKTHIDSGNYQIIDDDINATKRDSNK